MIVLINLSALLDDAKCFELVRQTRWLQGFRCPKCPICRVNIEILMNGLIS
jgi:Transposase zinc-ribbon domain